MAVEAKNSYGYTMVSTSGIMNGKKREYQLFTLLDTMYRVSTVDIMTLTHMMRSNPNIVSNMEIGSDGKPKSSNGSLERYGFKDMTSGCYAGVPTYVIIDRIEENGDLKGYTIYTPANQLAVIDVATAVTLAEQKLICNGKIRVSGGGNKSVSSIKGEYNIREVETPKKGAKVTAEQKKEAEVVFKPMFTTYNNNIKVAYIGIVVSAKRMDVLTRVIQACEEARKGLVDQLAAVGGEKVRDELKPIFFDSTEQYIVIPNDVAFQLCEQFGAKFRMAMKNMQISVMHYLPKKDGEFVDAKLVCDSKLNLKKTEEYENEKIAGTLNAFAEDFVKKISSYVKN